MAEDKGEEERTSRDLFRSRIHYVPRSMKPFSLPSRNDGSTFLASARARRSVSTRSTIGEEPNRAALYRPRRERAIVRAAPAGHLRAEIREDDSCRWIDRGRCESAICRRSPFTIPYDQRKKISYSSVGGVMFLNRHRFSRRSLQPRARPVLVTESKIDELG